MPEIDTPFTLCVGELPMAPRLAGWVERLCADPLKVFDILDSHGSPVHLHNPAAMFDNIAALEAVADAHHVPLDIFFARKANKAMCYVQAAHQAGIGVDVASIEETSQALDVGVDPKAIVVTAAVKPTPLLELCVINGIMVVLDNADETNRIEAVAGRLGVRARVAMRVGADLLGDGAPDSRFGFSPTEVISQAKKMSANLSLEGLHFHLDGYSEQDRVAALKRCLQLNDDLNSAGVSLEFVDMGGGFPVSYLQAGRDWSAFWDAHREALLGSRLPITYRNDGLGLVAHAGEVVGTAQAYPHFEVDIAPAWLGTILEARTEELEGTIAEELSSRHLRLRCEPGRALLDGCGVTLAGVVDTKMLGRDMIVGLEMNSSNCRSRKSELFTDPILIPRTSEAGHLGAGYLMGAYCTESEQISSRRFVFEQGVRSGDAFLFANTAGYLMHFTESRSHQFPLPKNVVVDDEAAPFHLDIIDRDQRGNSGD